MGTEIVQKTAYHRDPKLRDLARGQSCLVSEVPGSALAMRRIVFHDPATVVWCHSNLSEHGKGKSLKAHDCFGFLGCGVCHMAIDQGRVLNNGERRRLQREAMTLTREYLIRHILIDGATDEDVEDDALWLDGWLTGRIFVA